MILKNYFYLRTVVLFSFVTSELSFCSAVTRPAVQNLRSVYERYYMQSLDPAYKISKLHAKIQEIKNNQKNRTIRKHAREIICNRPVGQVPHFNAYLTDSRRLKMVPSRSQNKIFMGRKELTDSLKNIPYEYIDEFLREKRAGAKDSVSHFRKNISNYLGRYVSRHEAQAIIDQYGAGPYLKQ